MDSISFYHHVDADGNSACEVQAHVITYNLRVDRGGKHNGKWFFGRPGKRVQIPARVATGSTQELEAHIRALLENGELD